MNRKKIQNIVVIIAILFFVIYFLPIKRNSSSDDNVVRIGVMLPLSGDFANLGTPLKGAMEVAIKHLEKMDTKYNYQFILEDNQFDNARSNVILSKFLSVDKIDALLDGGAGVGNVTSPISESKKLPHINVWSSDSKVANGKYNFINWTQPPQESEKMAKIIKQKGYKNVWIVYANHDGPTAMADDLKKVLDLHNIESRMQIFNIGTRDMRLDILKMEKDIADLYVLFLFDPDMSIFIKQAKEINPKTDVTAIETFSFIENINLIEGMWYVDAAEGSGKIMDQIKAHNKSNAFFGVSNLYDNIMLLVTAFEKAPSKDQAIEELLNIKEYDGVTGRLIQDQNGIFQSEANVKEVINGKAVIVEE